MKVSNSDRAAQMEHQQRKKKCFEEGRRKTVRMTYKLYKEKIFLKFK